MEGETMGFTEASPLPKCQPLKKKKAPNICSTILFKGYYSSIKGQKFSIVKKSI